MGEILSVKRTWKNRIHDEFMKMNKKKKTKEITPKEEKENNKM